MSFFEKIKIALQKMKGRLIVYSLAIIVGILGLVAPVSRAVTDANIAYEAGKDWFETFFTKLVYVSRFGENMSSIFTAKYFHNFFIGSFWFIIFALIFVFVGVYKALPKHEFSDIENGSSDWAQNGEQYKVLSKKAGIILAEKNYLPVDKRGNVNVLVVRRFWCW